MKRDLKDLITKLYHNDIIRYILCGGCTTVINTGLFYILRRLSVQLMTANIIAITTAVLLAYVLDSKFVFMTDYKTLHEHIKPFAKFISARIISMLIEIGGVWWLTDQCHIHDMISKCTVQIIVIILNYLFSKFFIFTNKKQ